MFLLGVANVWLLWKMYIFTVALGEDKIRLNLHFSEWIPKQNILIRFKGYLFLTVQCSFKHDYDYQSEITYICTLALPQYPLQFFFHPIKKIEKKKNLLFFTCNHHFWSKNHLLWKFHKNSMKNLIFDNIFFVEQYWEGQGH